MVDVEKLLLILKRILVYLPQKIKEKWQSRSIGLYLQLSLETYVSLANVLEKIMYKENRLDMRTQGMELLLLFLEDLETPDASTIGIFGAALPLEVFDTSYTKKIILPRKSLSGKLCEVSRISWRFCGNIVASDLRSSATMLPQNLQYTLYSHHR
jgi:hypothetical protein